jgi:hypothetical protein
MNEHLFRPLAALHYGLTTPALTAETVRAVLVHAALIPIEIRNVWCEGDSFLEWGEMRDEDETAHGLVYYSAPSEAVAVKQGRRIFDLLVERGIADPKANCHPAAPKDKPVALSVTNAADWSIEYTDSRVEKAVDYKHLMAARGLVGPDGDNPEYERGIAEFIVDITHGLCMDDKEDVLRLIRWES